MLKDHGFFIPFIEYLHDLEGLLTYLGEKIGLGGICIYCNGRGRAAYPTLHAVQQHMTAKSHCKIRFEEDADDDEFLDFYVFPSSVEDDEEGDEQDEGDNEEADETEQSDSKEKDAKSNNASDSESKSKANASVKSDASSLSLTPENSGEVTITIVSKKRHLAGVSEGGELVLTDGSRIGHRSLLHAYKQNIRPAETREALLITKMMNSYRALQMPGYQNKQTGVLPQNKRLRSLAQKQLIKTQMRGNLQKHYRSSTG
jgi:pre-60S factor REI1